MCRFIWKHRHKRHALNEREESKAYQRACVWEMGEIGVGDEEDTCLDEHGVITLLCT